MTKYLGIPNDDNDWLKYEGRCNIFTGIEMKNLDTYDFTDDSYWEMQEDEDTKRDIITALEKKGVRCESVEIIEKDIYTGIKSCVCICYYNKPYAIYDSEFFLEDLSGFALLPHCPLEFYFDKLIE